MRRYRTDGDFKLNCKSVAAVAFGPIPQLDEAMTTLEANLPTKCQFLIDWLEDYNVGKMSITFTWITCSS